MINRADVDGDGEERATRCPSPRRAPGSAARAFLAQVSREEFVRIMTYKVQAVATRCAWLGIHSRVSLVFRQACEFLSPFSAMGGRAARAPPLSRAAQPQAGPTYLTKRIQTNLERILKMQKPLLTAHWHDEGADWRGLAHTPAHRKKEEFTFVFFFFLFWHNKRARDWRGLAHTLAHLENKNSGCTPETNKMHSGTGNSS